MPTAAFLALALLACTPSESAPPVPAHGVRFEPAGSGDVATLVRAAARRASVEHRVLAVYVGATWCEPCRYFHDAALHGMLDDQLPATTLLEFDLDRDASRLAAAGYASQMIPLFAVPRDDGTASERRIEGSIHGAGSPAQITPRLRAILTPAAVTAGRR